MTEREEQITRLKERLKALSKKLSEAKETGALTSSRSGGGYGEQQQQLEDGVELQSIIRMVMMVNDLITIITIYN